jgi:hypothetical protein
MFIRQVQHQKARIAEFVFNILIIKRLGGRVFEEQRIVIYILSFSGHNLRSDFPEVWCCLSS